MLDSVGIGAMPDAAEYGDAGSDTLGNIARQRPLHLPNLRQLGLGNIHPIAGVAPVSSPEGAYGKCTLASPGKDTTTGHWEMAGILLAKPFPLFPHGFPPRVIEPFEKQVGRSVLGNKAASGTEIIRELGAEHMATGRPIVYTSADSVFQIAAHEEVIALGELYQMCRVARSMLNGLDEVGRVIARPFRGSTGQFVRTSNRKDFAVPPPPGMLLDRLSERKMPVHAIGKISDIFLGRGITTSTKTKDNAEGMARLVEALEHVESGLIFVNLVDFDQQFGHRNDVEGYASALEAVDAWLPTIPLAGHDLLILSADHGCDPTTASTDHSREFTPLLVKGGRVHAPCNLGTRKTLADIGQTVAEIFGTAIGSGTSFFRDITMPDMRKES